MQLLDLLVGLEERSNQHDLRITAFASDNTAYLTCDLCHLDVTVMIINGMGGWRIEPNLKTLDEACDADR